VLGASSLLIDGAAARVDDAGRQLPAGSVVDVLPPFAGG
jgi:molybdopterin converting factor small subunit